MFDLCGRTFRLCDGLCRRSFLRAGGLAPLGLSLPALLRARQATRAAETSAASGANTSMILFWMAGGPSHIDMYDMKPNAAEKARGPFLPVPTEQPGLDVCELMPRHAGIARHLAVIRSLHHTYGVHDDAQHLVQTGYPCLNARQRGQQAPAQGAVTAQLRGPREQGMPPYVCIPESYSSQKGFYQKAAFLSSRYNPLNAGGDPSLGNFRAPELALPDDLPLARLNLRRSLLEQVELAGRQVDRTGAVQDMDDIRHEAFELVAGKRAREAFDVSREPAALREQYGRHAWGQSALLARRLVEAGVTCVTINLYEADVDWWDDHYTIEKNLRNRLPKYDQALSALIADLDDRGLLDSTIVGAFGEFGRSPYVDARAGRGHWPRAGHAVLAGGGIRGGQVIGSTNDIGGEPVERPVSPGDLLASIYQGLGINPHTMVTDRQNRPMRVVQQGEPIAELFG